MIFEVETKNKSEQAIKLRRDIAATHYHLKDCKTVALENNDFFKKT